MMNSILISLCFVLIGAGCTTISTVTPTGQSQSLSYVALNQKLLDQTVHIFFVDGRQTTGEKLHLDFDTSSWVDPGSQNRMTEPTLRIDRIQTIDRTRGALFGGFVGLFGGGSGGLLIGLGGAPKNEDYGLFTGLAAAGAGAAGLLIGTVIGSLAGMKINYEIKSDSSMTDH
jgi:hypothetical protein